MDRVIEPEKKAEADAENEVSGFYLISKETNDSTSSQSRPATEEEQTTADIPEIDANLLVEEPTDELSVLLSENADGSFDQSDTLFIPKNPMPDPALVALAKSIESCYEQNQQEWTDGSAGNSHFDFTRLSRSSSMLPLPRKTFSWLRAGSFVAAAIVIAIAGAVGGWHAALNSSRDFRPRTPSEVTLSVDKSEPSASQASLAHVATRPPMIIQNIPESIGTVPTEEPVVLSSSPDQSSGYDKASNHGPMVDQLRDKAFRTEQIREASKPELRPTETITRKVSVNTGETEISPSGSPKGAAAISQSDHAKNESIESMETENAISTQTAENAEATAATETTTEQASENALSLPDALTREQVAAGFKAIYQRITQCAAGKHGIAKIQATLSGSGRVIFALVDGAFKGSKEGSCMALAVRKTTFPEFAQSKLTVEFPYVL